MQVECTFTFRVQDGKYLMHTPSAVIPLRWAEARDLLNSRQRQALRGGKRVHQLVEFQEDTK